jgi:hypothetical protein
MIRTISCIILLSFAAGLTAGDTIVTKQNKKYYGTVIDRNDKGFVMRTNEGHMVVIPVDRISRIIRNNLVYDLETQSKYYLEKRHPFLPFVVLGLASGIYSVRKYQDYKDHHAMAEAEKMESAGPEYTNLKDQSRKDLAWCIVSGLFSAGSFYIALRPMEVKVPMGKIKVSASFGSIHFALHF